MRAGQRLLQCRGERREIVLGGLADVAELVVQCAQPRSARAHGPRRGGRRIGGSGRPTIMSDNNPSPRGAKRPGKHHIQPTLTAPSDGGLVAQPAGLAHLRPACS